MDAESAIASGHAAIKEGRWLDASAAFESALANDEAPEALVGLAEALRWLGETRRSVALRERAHTLFRRRGDALNVAVQCVELCIEYEMSLGNHAAARGWLARGERLVDGLDAPPIEGWLWLCRSAHVDDATEAVGLIERALAVAREHRDIDLEWCALSSLGVALAAQGEIEGGLRCVDEAMAGALGGDWTDMGTVVFTSCQMLTACDLVADLDRARLWCRAADEFVAKYGAPFVYAKCHAMYGRVLLASGRWAEAERELAVVITRTRAEYPAVHALAVAGLAELWLRQGRLDDAEELLEQVDDPLAVARVDAALRLKRREPEAAAAILQRWVASDRLLAEHRASAVLASAFALLVEAQVALRDVDAARDSFALLVSVVDVDDRATAGGAYATMARGRLMAATTSPEVAVRCFEEAAARFASLELPYETACARLELARVLGGTQPEAGIAEARGALATFDRLGATSDADVAAALLRSWGIGGRTGPREAGVLSRREREVLALVAAGLSNPEIAERLVISRKTAAHHVSNVLSKLGVRNRAEAAAAAARMLDDANREATAD